MGCIPGRMARFMRVGGCTEYNRVMENFGNSVEELTKGSERTEGITARED